MGKGTNLRLLLFICCLVGLTGCKGKQEEKYANTSDGITDSITITPAAEEKGNNPAEYNEDNATEEEENDMMYQPTIAEPEKLFNGIEKAKAWKAIGYHNPLMSQRFGADPFAMVYGDRVYVYMTNDIMEYDEAGNPKENSYSKIDTINCVSSEDLVNWTDHGSIKVGGVGGGSIWTKNSWAPAAAHKTINGKEQFFLYYANNASSIGVLRSDSPVGPFTDPLGKPMITKENENCSDITWLFDPAVFTDDDGKSYLYFGGGVPEGKDEMPNTARAVELGEDMISLKGTPVTIEAPFLFEDSGINKIGDTYYYTYCSNWIERDGFTGPYVPGRGEIISMTSRSPLGPWEYQGSIFKNPGTFFGTWGNNHHCMLQFKDKMYLFYHAQWLQDTMGIKGGYRSTHVDTVTINEDGSIPSIQGTKFGVEQVKNFNPYQVTEAETMAWMGGINTIQIAEESSVFGKVNHVVTDITTGDWIGLSNVDFGDNAPVIFTAKVSSKLTGNVIRITVDAVDGDCLGYLEVPNTGSLEKYAEVTAKVNGVTGVHNLFFTFSGEGFQFDNWSFGK